MKTLQQQIKEVEQDIKAEQELLSEDLNLLKQQVVSPVFISSAVVISSVVGYLLTRNKMTKKLMRGIGLALVSPVAKKVYKGIMA